jgi:hypothetical protein
MDPKVSGVTLILVLELAKWVSGQQEISTCEPIKVDMCKQIGYNKTGTDNRLAPVLLHWLFSNNEYCVKNSHGAQLHVLCKKKNVLKIGKNTDYFEIRYNWPKNVLF